MNRKAVFAGAIAVLVLVFGGAVATYRHVQATEAAQAAVRNQTYLVRDGGPELGPRSARVHIVEFMDPACSTCREFSPLVKAMLKAHPGDIRLSIRHVAFHPGSEEAVRAMEAARLQDKYWETTSALFAAQDRWVINHRAVSQQIWAVLATVGLDLDRLRRDMESPEVGRRIAQDALDARILNVTQTPEFFVNGKPLPSFGYEQLNDLVRAALADAS